MAGVLGAGRGGGYVDPRKIGKGGGPIYGVGWDNPAAPRGGGGVNLDRPAVNLDWGGEGGYEIPGNVGAPQMPYRPGAPAAAATAGTLAETGRGLLDPGSAYSRRMIEELTGQIGKQTGAQERLAALQSSQAGYGGGESPELLSALTDIGVGGQEAMGEGIGDLMLRSPELALQFLTPAMQAQLGISAQDLQAWLGQQQIQQQGQELGMEGLFRGQELDLARQQMNQQSMMQQLALMFSSA